MITLICHQNSTRLQYVLDYIAQRWAISIRIKLNDELLDSPKEILINYTNQASEDHFSIYNEGLLFEDHIRNKDEFPTVKITDNLYQLFPAEYDRYNLNFDIFSAIFFCLSRYEEYLEHTPDEHGRFTASMSHAFEHNYLTIPVVDIWLRYLKKQLNEKYQLESNGEQSFSIQPTIDVDSAWAFQHRSTTHQLASTAKNVFSLNMKALNRKWALKKGQKDPYDTFEYLHKSLHKLSPIYFMLMNFERPYDTAHYLKQPAFLALVNQIAEHSEIGIHPSYASVEEPSKVRLEKESLEKMTHRDITKSRQHFLRLQFPESYEILISMNIKEDYSMGYADHIGFRAGTSLPFTFYHLTNEEATDLVIQPFCIMDVTLKNYHQYSSDEAVSEVIKMKNMIKKTNGCLNFIWHNSSFAAFEGWAGWETIFEELIKT